MSVYLAPSLPPEGVALEHGPHLPVPGDHAHDGVAQDHLRVVPVQQPQEQLDRDRRERVDSEVQRAHRGTGDDQGALE